MTRAASAFLFFLVMTAAPLAAAPTRLVDDVIRMSRAGVSDDAIVAFVQTLRDRPAVTADEVIAMKGAGVSDAVIRAMIVEQGPPPVQGSNAPQAGGPGDPGQAPPDMPPAGQIATAEPGGCVVFEPPIPPFYEPPYPAWIWNPNWYQPTLDAKGGTNPTESHVATPRPVLDTVASAAPRAAGTRERDKPPARDDATRERPARERDSGSRSHGGRH
jgi:hypothetical protein